MKYRITLTPHQLAELLWHYHQSEQPDPPLIALVPGLQVLKECGKLSDYRVEPEATKED